MKKLILAVMFLTVAMTAMAANAGDLFIDHQFGFSTVEGGNSAPFIEVKAVKMFNNYLGVAAGGLVAGETSQKNSGIVGNDFVYSERLTEHQGVFAGPTLVIDLVTITSGVIFLDIESKATTKTTDIAALPGFVAVSVADLSRTSVRPFLGLNYIEKLSDHITLNAGLMVYEVIDSFVFNTGVGASFKF